MISEKEKLKTKVVCNDKNIYIPLQNNAKVYLASKDEINYALGLKGIRNPLCCGYLEMYEGTGVSEKVTLPVNLNSKFIIGPEGAHLNISGISGLAAKTSYSMFLMKAIQPAYILLLVSWTSPEISMKEIPESSIRCRWTIPFWKKLTISIRPIMLTLDTRLEDASTNARFVRYPH